MKPFPQIVGVAATHCGAGCTLGDICAEWIHYAVPFTIAGVAMFGAWSIDYVLALAFGIAFQYFTIVPMRNLPPGKGLVQALKADFPSLTARQVGMVRVDGSDALRRLSSRSPENGSGLLVFHADCDLAVSSPRIR
jgi:hypothetical protein